MIDLLESLQLIRKDMNVSLELLARKLKIDPHTLRDWENGTNPPRNYELFSEWARQLGYELKIILERGEL